MPAGTRVLAPSPIAVSGQMYTDKLGMQNYPIPVEMNDADIRKAIEEYATCAELAIKAGFDGIELHAANGYLMEQFLSPNSNKRTDAYGANAHGRMRFILLVAQSVAKKIGADRMGIRLSPYGANNDTGAFEGIDEFYTDLTKNLSTIGLLYIHIVDHSSMGAPAVSEDLKRKIRSGFKGAYIMSGGYDVNRAEHDLTEGSGDLVAFGRPFISNPDLVEKFISKTALKPADQTKFYTPGRAGYTDYI